MNIPSADTDAWNNAEGKRNGKVSIIRYRPELEQYLGHSDYPKRLVIIWDYEELNASGVASPDQIDEMGEFENTIVNALDPDRAGILVLVVTNAGVREWHFYINDVSVVGERINLALSGARKFPISIQVEEGEHWEELRNVYKLCGE